MKLCGEAQADAGTCGPESQIGETIVSVGRRRRPVHACTGGKVYITGPYKGAPFGLSIVNPAKAGPFDLGKVVVRAKIEVDPHTAALTITTDTKARTRSRRSSTGSRCRSSTSTSINRPGFTFNPTNCSPLEITGTLRRAPKAPVLALSVPFQVTNCAVLAFKPKLTARPRGRPRRANGASLTVKLGYPAGAV